MTRHASVFDQAEHTLRDKAPLLAALAEAQLPPSYLNKREHYALVSTAMMISEFLKNVVLDRLVTGGGRDILSNMEGIRAGCSGVLLRDQSLIGSDLHSLHLFGEHLRTETLEEFEKFLLESTAEFKHFIWHDPKFVRPPELVYPRYAGWNDFKASFDLSRKSSALMERVVPRHALLALLKNEVPELANSIVSMSDRGSKGIVYLVNMLIEHELIEEPSFGLLQFGSENHYNCDAQVIVWGVSEYRRRHCDFSASIVIEEEPDIHTQSSIVGTW